MRKVYFFIAMLLMAVSANAKPMGLPVMLAPEGEDPTDVIISPQGDVQYYDVRSGGWVYWGAWAGLQYFDATNTRKIVWGEDNDVYFYNPIQSVSLASYMKGTVDGDKITVQLPQCVGSYYDSELGEYAPLYINKMETVEQDGEQYYMIVNPEDNFIVYDMDEEGNITLNLGNEGSQENPDVNTEEGVQPKYILGQTYSNEPYTLQVWSGYGDAYQVWTAKNDGDPVCPPETAEFQRWAFNTRSTTMLVNVAIDGDDYYFSGLATYAADFWVKGTLNGDEMIIESNQFLGMNQYEQFYYYVAGEIYVDDNGWNKYRPIEYATMYWDPETMTLTSKQDEVWLFCSQKNSTSASAIFENPKFWYQTPEMLNAAPKDPVCLSYTEFDGVYKGSIKWDIPNTNVNEAILDTDNMYYNLYMDGEIFIFTPEEYPLFEEDTENVPYDASDWYNIYVYKTTHTIYLTVEGAETWGLQSFFVGSDGETYASNLVTYDVYPTGVEINPVGKEIKNVTYTSMTGITTVRPSKGIYIMTLNYSDGSSEVKKVSIR